MNDFIRSWRVGLLLGVRQVQRSSIWMNILIILIMTLTFLNMVVVPGILIGLIEGGNQAFREQYAGDIFISELSDKSFVDKTIEIEQAIASIPETKAYSRRMIERASVEANFQSRRDFDSLPNQVGTSIVGVDLEREKEVSDLPARIVEGEYLRDDESGYILIGATLLKQYSNFSDLFEPLENVETGSVVKVKVGDSAAEFTVKGVVKTKVDEVSLRIFMNESDFKRLTGRTNNAANELAIRLEDGATPTEVKSVLVARGFDRYAKIQTFEEAIPKFLNDIKITFGILGNVIGGIGIIVSAITIFVVIYINALTRRKYIGILKGIGINGRAIRSAYLVQSLFYALVGILLGLVIVYVLLVPAFQANPLDFPFSDGILVAPFGSTAQKMISLSIVTLLAGFVPAWLIVRKNTLDSILGR